MTEDYTASQLSGFLQKWNQQPDENISDEIIQFVYDELRRQAHNFLR